MGLAFKENCPDLRNTRVIDIVQELADYGVEVDVYDPWIDARRAPRVRHRPDRAARQGRNDQPSSPWRTSASRSWHGGDPLFGKTEQVSMT